MHDSLNEARMEFESVTLRPFFTSATPGMVVPDCRSDKAGAGVVGPDALVRIGREMKASQDPGRESGGRVVDAMCLRIMLIDAKRVHCPIYLCSLWNYDSHFH